MEHSPLGRSCQPGWSRECTWILMPLQRRVRVSAVSRAMLWRPVIGASLLLLTTVSQCQAETIRVVTFNLLHGGPWSGLIGNGADLNERLEMVVAQLAALRPDVVALQEASVGGQRGNVAERLGKALGMEWIHAPTTSRVFGIGWLDRRSEEGRVGK